MISEGHRWRKISQGQPSLAEKHLASRRAPTAHTRRGKSALDKMTHSRAIVLLRSSTHHASGICSHLLSGRKQPDLVSHLDAKPRSLPSVLRKSMLVGGYHMVASTLLSCSMIFVETKYCSFLPWSKLPTTDPLLETPWRKKVSAIITDKVWGFWYLWRESNQILVCVDRNRCTSTFRLLF